MKASTSSPRMFDNDFIDYFSRTHALVVPALFGPAIAGLLVVSQVREHVRVTTAAALLAAGFAVWTLVEYWLHRMFFHWKPRARWGERMHFLVHGVHHTWPRDKYRLVMPPAVSVSLFVLFLGLFLVLLGPVFAWAFHAGFVAGYVNYDLTHYWLHHGKPLTERGRLLKKHHMQHHFKDDTRHFGVSFMFWDRVFGTRDISRTPPAQASRTDLDVEPSDLCQGDQRIPSSEARL
jgi:dihydroceramide fatty acyl 2-hydroxylase